MSRQYMATRVNFVAKNLTYTFVVEGFLNVFVVYYAVVFLFMILYSVLCVCVN